MHGLGFRGDPGLTLLLLVLCVWGGLNGEALAESAVAKDARLGGDMQRIRFVADLSKAVQFRVFTLADPYRVIVDLPEVKFQMPSGLGAKGMGLVSAYRYGLFGPGKSRIVIDLAEPALVEKAFVREPANGMPARLVIDLVRTTHKTFMEKQRERAAGEEQRQADKYAAPGPGSPGLRQAPVIDLGDALQKQKMPIIVLDPGHGGVDGGTRSPGGMLEKEVVFAFCEELKKRLEAPGRFRVILTRDNDMFIPLNERVNFARYRGGDLFISVHADALDAKHPLLGKAGAKIVQEVRGSTVYTLSEEASDEAAKASAARENRSDLVAGMELTKQGADEVANILSDLVQRETKNHSIAFAKTLLANLKDKINLNPKAHRFANFRVLKAPDVPSVLFELGYLSNAEDEKLLGSPEWRAKVVESVAQSVDSFFAKREVRLPF